MSETDSPTPTIPTGVKSDGPIQFEGSPSQVANQLICAIQGLKECLSNHGLKAHNPADSIGSSPDASSYHPGSARHEWLFNRWDALTSFLVDALATYGESTDVDFPHHPAKPWVLCRWAHPHADGEWRESTASEAADELDIDQSTVEYHRKQLDQVIDSKLKQRGWSLG